jgi:hypothetical protein
MGGSHISWEGDMAESEVNFFILPPVYWVALWNRSREIEPRQMGDPSMHAVLGASRYYRQAFSAPVCGIQQWKNRRTHLIIRGYNRFFASYHPDISTQMGSRSGSAIRIFPSDIR